MLPKGINQVFGLYAMIAGTTVAFGSSKRVVMGPEATSAIMTAAVVAPLAG
ncbi:SulP family inorganic anion transporter [Chloroflexota bacterium]